VVNIKTLLPGLKKLVVELAEDLLVRSTENAEIDAGLREAFSQIERGGRTAQAFETWREDYLDQVAVAWVLACVFVRFMEDNHLIDECWLAGEGERRKLAEDAHELFFREHAHDTDREYFQHVFKEVGKSPAAKDLFAEGKTPLWAVAPSGDAAMKLLKFWREMDGETGHLQRSFEVESGDTRFLGDLYQDLSERAKKKFALLQTPVFVEEFILDRTLTPAIDEFGLEKVRMIDPTCGSGHFLLGTFGRLFDLWSQRESNEIKAAQKALDGVWGVDINPFAVAIARFRLIVAAVQACGIKHLKRAPGWNIHLASGDSLLFGSKPSFGGGRVGIAHQLGLFEIPDIYAVEDPETLQRILDQGYHVVVGNPPYITVKDKAQNEAYRQLYSTCHRQYSLGVTFTQRFWELAIQSGESEASATGAAGYIGMITANSFMKREFGKKLIEDFFPKVDLTHVIDTSRMGHTLVGHGTPTVMLFGRNRKPVSEVVRAVLGIKGEPSTTEDPEKGLVWNSILRHIDVADADDEYTSTADLQRINFGTHPWSIGGGGAAELKDLLELECGVLADCIELIGYICMTRADDVYFADRASLRRAGLKDSNIIINVEGHTIRDWFIVEPQTTVFPYDDELNPVPDEISSPVIRFLWPYRTLLWTRREPNGDHSALGLTWYEWSRFQKERYRTPLSIPYAFFGTQNHFVFERGGKIFNQSTPIIKLPANSSEADHLSLLGLLNSSTACLWLKQVFHDKGGGGIGGGLATEFWEHFYEFNGTGLQRFPIPSSKPLVLPQRLDALGREHGEIAPSRTIQSWDKGQDLAQVLADAKCRSIKMRQMMIALQEELDWECYQLYGLLSEDLRYAGDDLPELALGQRSFEIVMARRMSKGELATTWFERHGSVPITEIPTDLPAAYRRLVERRIKVIETNKEIALIEKPECKRRWNDEPWEDQQQRSLKHWLLDRLETPKYRKGTNDNPELITTAQMADVACADTEFLEVAALFRGRADFNVAAIVAELVEAEAVPFLPILRYKATGLRKREDWERTWDLQRQQDAGKDVGDIPVPRKYTNSSGKVDFLKPEYWRLRGSLDVPKERWISYPHCHTDSDQTLVVGWAGWNHLQQATALIAYYDARKREGWDAKRLTPLLAGLDQLLPWIHQWHPEIDKEFGETAGQSFQTMLEHDAHELGLTLEDIRNWTPPEKAKKTSKGRKKKVEAEDDE
jgi:hypothetical protein